MGEVAEKQTSSYLSALKADFPIFKQKMNGKDLVYLDSASSAQKPQVVIDAMSNAMESHYANIHRGLYEFSQTTTKAYEDVRKKVARFIGAKSENEIIFTRNTTEGINLVAHSWAEAHMDRGDAIILTEMEHHANIVPWQLLADRKGLEIRVLPVTDAGELDMGLLDTFLDDKVKLMAFVAISNSLGTINPSSQIIEKVKKYNPDIKVMLDGTQEVVHKPVNISGDYNSYRPDFYALTGHKLYGPTGVGVLYVREDIIDDLPPFLGGGDMIERVSFDGTTFKSGPARFEAGTPPIVEVIGLGAAIDYLAEISMADVESHEALLLAYATEELIKIDGIKIIGEAVNKAAILSFVMQGAHPSDIGMILDQMGVAIRTGHHCCMPLMQRFGVDSTARASFGIYNSFEDCDKLIEAVRKAGKMLW